MIDRLAAPFPRVSHDPEPVTQSLFARDLANCDHQMPQQGCVGFLDFSQVANLLTRDHEDMSWGARVNVLKRDAMLVLVNKCRWDIAINDFFKDRATICHDEKSSSNTSLMKSILPVNQDCIRLPIRPHQRSSSVQLPTTIQETCS
jgi:hypothetical protein